MTVPTEAVASNTGIASQRRETIRNRIAIQTLQRRETIRNRRAIQTPEERDY